MTEAEACLFLSERLELNKNTELVQRMKRTRKTEVQTELADALVEWRLRKQESMGLSYPAFVFPEHLIDKLAACGSSLDSIDLRQCTEGQVIWEAERELYGFIVEFIEELELREKQRMEEVPHVCNYGRPWRRKGSLTRLNKTSHAYVTCFVFPFVPSVTDRLDVVSPDRIIEVGRVDPDGESAGGKTLVGPDTHKSTLGKRKADVLDEDDSATDAGGGELDRE